MLDDTINKNKSVVLTFFSVRYFYEKTPGATWTSIIMYIWYVILYSNIILNLRRQGVHSAIDEMLSFNIKYFICINKPTFGEFERC